jgi:two-component system, response regulator, stage 0 sporulation protein F
MSIGSSDNGTMTCWQCDETVDTLTDVVIWTPSGGQATLALCRRCYESIFLPLRSEVTALRPRSSHSGTILVVDDDLAILTSLSMWLHDDGLEVVTASNGLEALDRVRDQVPAAIVLDLRMPVMSGPEFLDACRNAVPPISVPVIAMSAYHRNQPTEALGVQTYLAKPFSPDALTTAIVGILA